MLKTIKKLEINKIIKKLKINKFIKKLKINKIIKICCYILIFFGFFLLIAEFSLRYFLPLPRVKAKILDKVSNVIGAKLTAGEITAGLFNIEIDNVILDTGKDNILTCKRLKIRQNPLKLLKGQISLKHIYIDEPILQIIRYKDGSFNFDPLLSEEENKNQEKNSSKGIPIDLRIKRLILDDAKIAYIDLTDDIKVNINNFHLSVNDFSFFEPFELSFSFTSYFEQKDLKIDEAKIALSSELNLKGLELKDAYLNLKQFLVDYKDTLLKIKTKMNNFEDPSALFDIELKNLSNETLRAFADTAEFDLPLITAKGNIDYLAQKEKLAIHNLTLATDDTEIDFKGNLNFAKTFETKGRITLKSVLDSLGKVSPLVEEYKPQGQISADFAFAWPLELSGKCDLTDVGFFVDKAGTFKDINTSIDVKSIDDIKIEQLKGILNKNPFTAKASYVKKQNYADVFLDFKADKLYVIDTSKKEETTPEQTELAAPQTTPETKQQDKAESLFVPININAKIDIAKLDIPYLKGNKVVFNAKAKNITSQMDQTHGTFELNIQDGQIKDVYTISNANAITKIMFMSLGIVSRVINTLNVLDLLSGMGKLITGSKAEGDEDEVIEHQEINGKMDFDSFQTLIDFDDGLATMKKCSFVSNLFSFRVNGKINFNDRNIKLNVDSAPGKHTEDGIMPLNINIKGTIEEPKGSMSVLSSVSALVGDTVTNNPVSNMLKKGWSKLFSSKGEEASNEDDADSTELSQEQEDTKQDTKENQEENKNEK